MYSYKNGDVKEMNVVNNIQGYNGKRSVIICFVAALFCLYQVLVQVTPSLIIDDLMMDLHIGRAQVGLIASSLFYTYLLFQIPAGVLIDKYGVSLFIPLGIGTIAIGAIILSFANTMFLAVFARIIMGAGSSVAIISGLALASKLYSLRWFPLLVGMYEMSSMLGGAIATYSLPYINGVLGWRGTMLVCAGIGGGLFILAVIATKNIQTDTGRSSKLETENIESTNEYSISNKSSNNRQLIFVNFVYGMCMFCMINSFIMLWGLPYMKVVYGDHKMITTVLAVSYVFVALGNLVSGWLSGLLGKCQGLMIIGSLACIVSLSAILFIPISFMWMSVNLIVFGFFSGFYGLAFLQPRKSATSSNLGLYMSVINGGMLISGIIFQPVIGLLLDRGVKHHQVNDPNPWVYDYQLSFVVLILVLVIAVFMALRAKD